MPGLLGAVISVVMAGIASPASYDKFSAALPETEKSMTEIFLAAPTQQAVNQLLALLTTLALATFGGLVTGQEMSVSSNCLFVLLRADDAHRWQVDKSRGGGHVQ